MISAAKYGHVNQEGIPLTAPVVSEGRDRVLREARVLFIERGFAEVSMQQIADAAGMTKAALYYHFRDKEDLFGHVVLQEQERTISGILSQLEEGGSFRTQVERIVHFFFIVAQSDFGRMMSDVHHHVSESCQRSLKINRMNPGEFLRPYFEHAAANGELREIDVDLAIRFLLSVLIGLKQMSEHMPDSRPLTQADTDAIVDVVLHGIGAPARP